MYALLFPSHDLTGLRNGWLDDIFGQGRVSPTKWTKEMLQDIVNNFETRGDLKRGNNRAYNYLLSKGLLDNFYGPSERNPSGYWTKDKAHEEALKYTNRRDFGLGSPKAASVAKANGWWDEITSHMGYLGSLYERAVYAWEFPSHDPTSLSKCSPSLLAKSSVNPI